MFAEGKHLNILNNNQLIMVLMENCSINKIPDIFFVAFGEVEHSLGISLRGLPQALSLWVLSNAFKYSSYSTCKFLNALFSLLRSRFQSCSRAGTYPQSQLAQIQLDSNPKAKTTTVTYKANSARQSQLEDSQCTG